MPLCTYGCAAAYTSITAVKVYSFNSETYRYSNGFVITVFLELFFFFFKYYLLFWKIISLWCMYRMWRDEAAGLCSFLILTIILVFACANFFNCRFRILNFFLDMKVCPYTRTWEFVWKIVEYFHHEEIPEHKYLCS